MIQIKIQDGSDEILGDIFRMYKIGDTYKVANTNYEVIDAYYEIPEMLKLIRLSGYDDLFFDLHLIVINKKSDKELLFIKSCYVEKITEEKDTSIQIDIDINECPF